MNDNNNTGVSHKIIEKIQKLMALANKGTNVNESAAAMAQAQTLLMKHRLSMAEVELADKAFKNPENITEGTRPLYEGQRIVHWKSTLAYYVANLNSCKMFYHHGFKSVRYMLVGRASDMEIVHYFYESITGHIERLCKETMSAGLGTGKTFSNNFKHGAVETVVQRLTEEQNKIRSEYQGSAALVLVDRKGVEVEQWMKQNMNLRKMQNTNVARGNNNARNLGREAGQRVPLNKGIGGGSNRGGGLLT